ncbi:hypothetical protein ACFQ2M_38335 [Kitasatospora saccharophila]|uniref:hypothetical protein n=1 Tax=Kitasatospora saccharophila TaxID=407973 RepID=UPI00362D8159
MAAPRRPRRPHRPLPLTRRPAARPPPDRPLPRPGRPPRPLLDWTGRPGFGAHLLHGPGGQGKTRLAQHLADTAAERTQVLWLDAGAPPGELAVLADTTRPLLVVVDYAETRAPQLLALLDAAHRHRGPHPFKLLLLARTAGDWWDNLQSATSRAADLLDGAPTTPLGPLEPEPGRSRTQAYREALDGYARHLPDVDDWQHHDWPALAARLRDREVDATALGTALTLHMTALADLLDAATGTTAGDTAPGAAKVEDRLLHHERRYWTAAAETRGLLPALSEATLEDALTAAFLLGARDRAEGDTVLHRVPALADQTRDRRTLVSDWITSLYPPPATTSAGDSSNPTASPNASSAATSPGTPNSPTTSPPPSPAPRPTTSSPSPPAPPPTPASTTSPPT